MGIKRVEFNKEKISYWCTVSSEFLESLDLSISSHDDDFIRDMFTMKMDAHFLSNMADNRTLRYYCKRPRFFDWLFRRTNVVEFNLDVKDLLLNPPKLPNTVRTYVAEEITR